MIMEASESFTHFSCLSLDELEMKHQWLLETRTRAKKGGGEGAAGDVSRELDIGSLQHHMPLLITPYLSRFPPPPPYSSLHLCPPASFVTTDPCQELSIAGPAQELLKSSVSAYDLICSLFPLSPFALLDDRNRTGSEEYLRYTQREKYSFVCCPYTNTHYTNIKKAVRMLTCRSEVHILIPLGAAAALQVVQRHSQFLFRVRRQGKSFDVMEFCRLKNIRSYVIAAL
ncbi:hypothetical protein Q8A73_016557 [Channa argus]|nr:hypothetical protein Q8A73_016557 [Channa argus]